MPEATPALYCGFSISREGWEGIAHALGLTRRELQVLECVVGDQHENGIAATLRLSRNTVRTYLKRLRAKLRAASRVQMIKRVVVEYAAWLARSYPP
jgi:DNA-binding CsgD family transcriptional regulator